MALDGITTSAIVSELKAALLGGRIDKIHQPLRMKFVCQFVGGLAAAQRKSSFPPTLPIPVST